MINIDVITPPCWGNKPLLCTRLWSATGTFLTTAFTCNPIDPQGRAPWDYDVICIRSIIDLESRVWTMQVSSNILYSTVAIPHDYGGYRSKFLCMFPSGPRHLGIRRLEDESLFVGSLVPYDLGSVLVLTSLQEASLLALHQHLEVTPHLHLLHAGAVALLHRLLLVSQALQNKC